MKSLLNLDPLVNWFNSKKRDLPWRNTPSPYAVWVSETMLQQTQVKTVIPYFERWMEAFPTIETLAQANEETVLKMWEGLGYYSRARNLHAGAKLCVLNWKGKIPEDKDELLKIKGIGPYTLGAIQSFAFHKRSAAIDGNVLRVISRLIGYEKEIEKSDAKRTIEQTVLESLPERRPWVAMEAIIELGALVCKKSPLCESCPLKNQCLAFNRKKIDSIPLKKKMPAQTLLTRHAIIISTNDAVLLHQGKKGKVMEGLWEFPYFENTLPKDAFGYDLTKAKPLGKVTHTFTRFKVDLYAWSIEVPKILAPSGYTCVLKNHLTNLPFSSGMRQLLQFSSNTL